MKITLTLLVAGISSALVLAGTPAKAALPTIVITDVRGSVNIQMPLPCGDPVNQTSSIERGIMDVTPLQITGDTALFDLTRLDMFVTPFSLQRTCDGISAAVHFREIGVQLAGAVRFTGDEIGSRESNVFRFRIPKEQFLIFETIVDDAPGHTLEGSPETSYQRPSEDVFGVIDLRRKTVELHVVLSTKVRLRAGCVRGSSCLIDQIETVTQTSDVSGAQNCPAPPAAPVAAFVDVTPPQVSCTATNPPGNAFLVVVTDDNCIPPTIALGAFPLSNGEVIQISVTGTPGVRLVETSRADGLRHFQVGRGDAVVTATDPAGNVGSAACR